MTSKYFKKAYFELNLSRHHMKVSLSIGTLLYTENLCEYWVEEVPLYISNRSLWTYYQLLRNERFTKSSISFEWFCWYRKDTLYWQYKVRIFKLTIFLLLLEWPSWSWYLDYYPYVLVDSSSTSWSLWSKVEVVQGCPQSVTKVSRYSLPLEFIVLGSTVPHSHKRYVVVFPFTPWNRHSG